MRNRCIVTLLALLVVTFVSGLGQAPPPANSPNSAAVEQRVESLLSKMTLEEKIDMIGGVDGFFIRGIPRLALPPLKMADGPIGVRNFGPATAMAGGIALAATWNPSLAQFLPNFCAVEEGRN